MNNTVCLPLTENDLNIIIDFNNKLSYLVNNNLIPGFDYDFYNSLDLLTKDLLDQIYIDGYVIINNGYVSYTATGNNTFINNSFNIKHLIKYKNIFYDNKESIYKVEISLYFNYLYDCINIINIVGIEVLKKLFISTSVHKSLLFFEKFLHLYHNNYMEICKRIYFN